MLSFPNWMTFSTGFLALLHYGVSVNAQIIPTSTSSQNNVESSELFPVPSRAADLMEPPRKLTGVRNEFRTPAPRVRQVRQLARESTPSQQGLRLPTNRKMVVQRYGTDDRRQTPSQQAPVVQPTPEPQVPTQPIPEQQTPQSPSVPQNVNPNANPLLFPTAPTEVEIRTVQPITLEQAVEISINNNEQIKQARFALERANAELREVRSIQFPTVNSQIDFNRESNFGVRRQREAANQNLEPIARRQAREGLPPFAEATVNGQITLNYNVFSAGERPARILAARKEVQRNLLEVERISEQIRFEATESYYLLQRSDAQVAIAQAAVEDASVSLRDARLLEQAGLGTRFSVLQAEVDLARANQDLTRSIADQRIARRRLAEILNVGQRIELTASDEIDEAGTWPITLEQTIVQAFKNRAELEQQILQREINEQNSIAELATIKPQFDFVAQYNFDDSFDDRFSVAEGYFFVARMRWLIFDAGRAEARARQNYRNMDIANAEFARLRDEIRFNVEEAYYNLIANQENIQTANTNVITATESLRLARLRFQAGVGTQIDVINAQRDLTQARSDYLQAIIDYNRSLNQLQRQVSNWPDDRLFDVF